MLPYLLAFCRIAIGLVFACAFLAKVRRAAGFAQTIANFDLLPRRWSKTAALLFLGGEVVVVILLILGGWLLPLAFALAGLVLLLFTSALISVLRRNIKTSCNCFGVSEKSISYFDVWRNVGFGLVIVLGLWSSKALALVNTSLSLIELLFITLMASAFVLFWTNFRTFIAVLRPV